MEGLIPDQLVEQIFRLKLEARLIADKKATIPIKIKGKHGRDGYKVLINLEKKELDKFSTFFLELKGNVDIEYLKYGGEVKLIPITPDLGYYKMTMVNFYKLNERRYKRVPYRRAIKIVQPLECEGVLVNISASGALIYSRERIPEDHFAFKFVLLKQVMTLNAEIVEQRYDEKQDVYVIRCDFDSIDKKSQKILQSVVKEITLRAKERLNVKKSSSN
ncbi:MAG: PilZ domain-containing protein [Cellulosilyticum sp.]|nr:PilZ domain-containing protein [Cellulosilyticum sp.]